MLYNTIVTSESATIMTLTPGETYTFLVYTRAADNITESDPVSYTTCTGPQQVIVTVNNYNSVSFLVVSWTGANGKVDHYNAILSGDMKYIPNDTTQTNFTNLIPGTEYTATVEVVSGNCNQSSVSVTEATYPTPPRNLYINTVGTNSLALSWMEPVNMTGVDKSYNIIYGNSSGTWTVTSNTTSISLQNLTSGTNCTITVVTVGVRGYQSSAVSTSVYTKPLPVKSMLITDVTLSSVFLTWSKPDEYKTSYSYRVQTNVTSSATMLYNTTVTSESATIMNLTPEETYTFLVYTRAADNITESDLPLTCTGNRRVSSIILRNSVDSLGVTWTQPNGNVTNYTVSLTGAVTNTTQTTATQVTITGLLPGREYTVTVQTNSGTCSQISAPVTQATYPTQPRNFSINTVTTNSLTLSWMEPVNMTGVDKSYNISYGNSSGTWTLTSYTTSISLQDLTSGTNYTITVVTVGVRGYQSSPVSTSVYTRQPDQPSSMQPIISKSNASMDITFLPFSSSNGPIVAYAVIITTETNGNQPPWGILSKTYDDFKKHLTKTYVTRIIEKPVTFRSVRSGDISVRVGDGTATGPYVNGPLDPELDYRVSIAGFSDIKYDPNTSKIIEEQSPVSFTSYTESVTTTATTSNTTTTTSRTTTPHTSSTTPVDSSSNTGAIAGGVVGGCVGVCALIGVGVLFWRRKRQKRDVLTSGKNNAKNKSYEDLFEKLQADNNKGFIMEYDSLQSIGVLQPRAVASHPANADKNRLDTSYPYDKSRVKLSTLENSVDGYINASYVPGHKSLKDFIVAQHPLPGTMNDFWYMIWEKRINTIVMLSSVQEDFKAQGEEYWPTTEAKTFGNILVTFISETNYSSWTVRDFMAVNVKSKESHQVRQFHYTDWHESGDMDDRHLLIRFLHQVHKYKKENFLNCATLVHCRTGTGRSGIFIALDCIIDQLEDGKSVNVYGTVHEMLLHRPLMVQTEVQYIFLHRCTLELVRGKNTTTTEDDYHNEDIYEEIPNAYHVGPQTPENEATYEQLIHK
ncbi:receptor-type tyrosine-protein phosphatase eta-like [Engystomops pustulosus]|uniref:receptor-type tyrosine-protein phosphatase eta-like n=1 Tax=Engystomops pustulosus TaxID=76066 RepID=UPI003AFADB87